MVGARSAPYHQQFPKPTSENSATKAATSNRTPPVHFTVPPSTTNAQTRKASESAIDFSLMDFIEERLEANSQALYAEALEQMELLGHAFYVYRDHSQEVRVIYRRADGRHGATTTS